MPKTLAAAVVALMVMPAQGLAQVGPAKTEPPLQLAAVHPTGSENTHHPLQTAALREAARLGMTLGAAELQQGDAQREPSWAGRHPVLLGTLIGLGAGVGYVVAVCRDWDAEGDVGGCGAYATYYGVSGAGIGAGIGALVSVLR